MYSLINELYNAYKTTAV